MNSGTRLLVKILVAVVSYGAVFALAIFALNQISGGGTNSDFAWIIIVILAIFGFGATKGLPFFYASGGGTGSIPVTLFLLTLRIMVSVFAGVFVAPWKIAKKLVSLVPGGAEDAGGVAEEEE